MRYEIKYGKFGVYFYDKQLKQDLDLLSVLMKLHRLENYEINQEKPLVLCLTCKSNPNNCCNYKHHLNNPNDKFDYCNCYNSNKY